MKTEAAEANIARAEAEVRSLAQYASPEAVSWANARAAILEAADALRILAGQNALPVKLEPILVLRRISSVALTALSSRSATLIPAEKGFRVLVEQGMHRVRRRASLAHEIGHTFFYDCRGGTPRKLFTKAGLSWTKEEDISWGFAESLLLPLELVLRIVDTSSDSRIEQARQVAAMADVSMEVAIRRLLHSTSMFAKCIAVVSVPDARRGRRVMRYWGSEAQRGLPRQLRQSTDRIKALLAAHESIQDARLVAGLDAEAAVGEDHNAQVQWMDWGGDWGGSLAIFIDPMKEEKTWDCGVG